jgi:hypothetical protein
MIVPPSFSNFSLFFRMNSYEAFDGSVSNLLQLAC